MELIKKTSLFSDSRFPMFVRGSSEFDNLRRFVQSYFESLEEEGKANNILTLAQEHADIDTTTEVFLDRFYSILCPGLPTDIKANKRLLLKHARELYQKKGTPESFHLLFKVIFNETVSLKYPHEFILRASDGMWVQPVAIHAVFGNTPHKTVLELINQDIVTIKESGIIRNTVMGVKRIDKSDTFEIMLDKQKSTAFEVGDVIKIGGTVYGAVVPSVTSIRILKAGKKFRIGQPLKLDLGDAKGTIVKVISIDNDGGIKKAKLIRYGIGYDTALTLTLSPFQYNTSDVQIIENADLPIIDGTDGFTEFGTITKMGNLGPQYDYFLEEYMQPTEYYTSAIVAHFGGSTFGGNDYLGGADVDDYAVISLSVGPVINYPGYWSDNKGKLSDPLICMQDNAFYQNFSYVIQSSVPRDQYESHVKQTIHPAGMRMFSDLLIDNVFDVNTLISSQDGVALNIFVSDLVDLPDVKYLDFNTPRTDTVDLVDTDDVWLYYEKALSDSITAPDSSFNDIANEYYSTITTTEYLVNTYARKFTDYANMIDIDSEYFTSGWVDYNFIEEAGSAIMSKALSTGASDITSVSDDQYSEFVTTLMDTASAYDNTATSFGMPIDDVLSSVDNTGTADNTLVDDDVLFTDMLLYAEAKYMDISIANNDDVSITVN